MSVRKAGADGGEARDLVAKPLGLDDCHLLADALVGVEIKGQAVVVLLDDDTRSLLDCLGADATLQKDNMSCLKRGWDIMKRAVEAKARLMSL